VILLDNVVQVLALLNPDRCFPPGIDRLKGRQIRAAFINRHSSRSVVLGNPPVLAHRTLTLAK
jgi:hypothetical protein